MVFRVAVSQMDTQDNKKENVAKIEEHITEAAKENADLIAFPENSTFNGPTKQYSEIAESIPGSTTDRLATLADRHNIYIHTGSFPESTKNENKFYNTSTFIDPSGDILAKYRKIHLFDVTIGDEVITQESEHIVSGNEIVTTKTDLATFGFTICYDLRFPELYSSLSDRGATVMFVPAAFTLFTGKDHWRTLLRTRAIENQAYIIAPGQIGEKPASVPKYGKSLIIDPWGNVTSQASDRAELIFGKIDPSYTKEVRQELPSLKHKRPDLYDQPMHDK